MLDITKNIPEPQRDLESWQPYRELQEDNYNYFLEKILALPGLLRPEKTEQPGELAYMLGAYLTADDTTVEMRRKSARAACTHRLHVVWDAVWKPVVDGITGGDAEIYKGLIYYGSFIVGESIVGSPAKIGPVSFVDMDSAETTPGDVYINLNMTGQPTQQQLDRIKRELEQLKPVYFQIYIGITEIVDSDFFVVGQSEVGGIDVIGEDLDPRVLFRNKLIF
jgi:hypothetical protein